MSSWIAAATSYSASGQPMIPFFIFYSMFGFQRIGDLCWAAGDMRARGFLIGGTAGRTTLNGEGLQHEDGNSHMMAGMVPNCVPYDPSFAYEVAVLVQDGLRRMVKEEEDVYYYITVMNENYNHPDMPEGAEEGIKKGLYLIKDSTDGASGNSRCVQLMGSGTILREAIAAANILEQDFGVKSDVWSATSFTELRRDGADCTRWNRLNPENKPRTPWVVECMEGRKGPVVAATDYVRAYADQIRGFLPQEDYIVLGTDGFGRSDTRKNLRKFFEVDRFQIAYAAMYALHRQGTVGQGELLEARKKLGIDPDKANPVSM
jgi:pyruvate dehydrogenase E1 component